MMENRMLSERLLSAETGVLGAMLIDEAAVGPMVTALADTDFQTPERRHIFQAILKRYAAGLPVDPLLVNEDLGGACGKLMQEMMDATPTSANAPAYAQALRETSRLWQLRQLGEALSQAEDLDRCRELADRTGLLLCERSGAKRMDLREGLRDFLHRHDGGEKPDYLRWGLEDLDREVHAGPGDMVVVGGYPSAGKTALALQLAFLMAQKKRVGFFSYETSAAKLFDRLAACQTQTSFRKIMAGSLTREDFERVYGMKDRLTGPQLELIEASGMTVSDIGAYAMARRYGVVMVDYLQKIPADRGGRSAGEFERVSQVSSGLQQLGRSTGRTVVALSQLSRPEKGKTAPTMASLRQSGQIEQDADVVMLLYKEFPDAPFSRRVLDVAKNKDGESNLHIALDFDGDKQRFRKSLKGWTPPEKEPDPQTSIFKPLPDNAPMPFSVANP